MLQRLEEYKSWWAGLSKIERDQFLHDLRRNKIGPDKKNEIKALAKYFFNKGIGWGCGSCWLDAHVLLVKTKIEEMEKKKSNFAVAQGTFLHDPITRDFNRLLTPHSITDELAIHHLAFNPRSPEYFTQKPDNSTALLHAFVTKLPKEQANKVTPYALKIVSEYDEIIKERELLETEKEKADKENNEDASPELTVVNENAESSDKDSESTPEVPETTESSETEEVKEQTPTPKKKGRPAKDKA